jgi:hypothetical protein
MTRSPATMATAGAQGNLHVPASGEGVDQHAEGGGVLAEGLHPQARRPVASVPDVDHDLIPGARYVKQVTRSTTNSEITAVSSRDSRMPVRRDRRGRSGLAPS